MRVYEPISACAYAMAMDCFVVCKLIFLWLTSPEAQPRRGSAGSSQFGPEDISQRVHFNEVRQIVVITSDSSYRLAKTE